VHLVGEACGANYPAAEKRTWEWEFQWFNPDRSAKLDENLDRCFSCHKSRERQDLDARSDEERQLDRGGQKAPCREPRSFASSTLGGKP
jgi:hypothetical protein